MSNVTNKDFYVLKFLRANPSLINDQNALIAEIWESEDFWKHTDLLTALRSVTSADSIKRSHRALRENNWIEVDKKLLRKNMRLMNKVRDERGSSNIHAIKNNIEIPPEKPNASPSKGLRKIQIKGDTAYIVEKTHEKMDRVYMYDDIKNGTFEPSVQTSLLGGKGL